MTRDDTKHFSAVQFEAEYQRGWKDGYKQGVAAAKTEPSKPQFKDFIEWANTQGYDCAHTCNSDNGKWICLNPMTADLWKAWQEAYGIETDPAKIRAAWESDTEIEGAPV